MYNAYLAETSNALTYSLTDRKRATRCAMAAMLYAQELHSPTLTYQANYLLSIVSK